MSAEEKAEFKLDTELPFPSANMLASIRKAVAISGRSSGSIFREIMRFKFGRVRMDDTEYFKYRLFDDANLSPEQKKEYVGGTRIRKVNLQLNAHEPLAPFVDYKLYVEAMLRGLGVHTTTTRAIVCADPAITIGNMSMLRSAQDLEQFFAKSSFPMFGKPLFSSLSIGAVALDAYDPSTSVLSVGDGTTVSVASLFDQIATQFSSRPFLLQDHVRMAPQLAPYTGSAVGTFRVVTCRTPDGLRPLYATWKIPSPNSMADNFWRNDNLLAFVDVDSGTITRCQKSIGVDAETIETHPGTGLPLVGLQVQDWDKVTDLAVTVASLFSAMGILGFDIALSKDGPCLIEANANPDHGLFQIASGRGFLTPEHREIIDWNDDEAKRRVKAARKTYKKVKREQRKRYLKNRVDGFKSDVEGSKS